MDSEIITVLREIRDESKQTNLRLESMEGRVEFLEKRLSHGLEGIKTTLVESIDLLTKQQTESELRLASEVVSLADVTREVRGGLTNYVQTHTVQQRSRDHFRRLCISSRLGRPCRGPARRHEDQPDVRCDGRGDSRHDHRFELRRWRDDRGVRSLVRDERQLCLGNPMHRHQPRR
jgi:hypothetical protein